MAQQLGFPKWWIRAQKKRRWVLRRLDATAYLCCGGGDAHTVYHEMAWVRTRSGYSPTHMTLGPRLLRPQVLRWRNRKDPGPALNYLPRKDGE